MLPTAGARDARVALYSHAAPKFSQLVPMRSSRAFQRARRGAENKTGR